jgi:hypothetical protein
MEKLKYSVKPCFSDLNNNRASTLIGACFVKSGSGADALAESPTRAVKCLLQNVFIENGQKDRFFARADAPKGGRCMRPFKISGLQSYQNVSRETVLSDWSLIPVKTDGSPISASTARRRYSALIL